MKIDSHVKGKTITIEMPEGVAAMYGFAFEDKFSSGMYNMRADQAIELATDFFCHILENAPDVAVAGALGTLRYQLRKHGIMPKSVDMAVSLNGEVIPLDEIVADIDEEIKKCH